MALQDDIKELTKILETTDEKFSKALKGVEVKILKAVIKLLDKLDSSRGNLIKSRLTDRLVRQLSKEIAEIFNDAKYNDTVSKFLESFDDVESLTAKTVGAVNGIKISTRSISPEKKIAIDNVTRRLTSVDSLQANLVEPIRRILFSAIRKGASVNDTKEALKLLVNPSKGTGFIQRYGRQIANDALLGYQGSVQTVIAEEYELNAFRYIGSLKKNSRQTCIDLINGTGKYAHLAKGRGVYLKKDIPEIIALSQGNAGWNPATTVSNFFELRGGWNCGHFVVSFRYEDAKETKEQKRVEQIPIDEKEKD